MTARDRFKNQGAPVPLRAYIDDSGTHALSPVCVAAGYFGGTYYWNQFDLAWGSTIKRRGLSEFHANRFWSRAPDGGTVGEYKDWSAEDCKIFLAELLEVIRQHRVWPVGSAVVLSEWNALQLDERRHLTGGVYQDGRFKNGGAPSKQYFVPFLFAVHNVAAHCDEGHVVDFVVDESKTLNGYAFEYFGRIKASNFGHAHKLGTIKSADSKSQPGLQAADLLAHLTLKRTRDNPGAKQEVEVDSPLGQAIRNTRDVNLDFKLLGNVAFDRLLKEFRERRQR